MALGWLWWRTRFPFVAVDAAAVCLAEVAFGSIGLHSVWQALHLATSTFTLRGRRGTYCMALGWLWWRAWFPFSAVGAAAVCLAGVAFGSIGLHSVWQAWRLATSTFTLYGMRGTYGTGLALVARLVPVCRHGRRGCLCGRRGIWKHRPHSVWQVWHLATSTIYLMHRAKRQSSASAKNLLQAVRSHDGLRGLLAHIAYAAKTNGCHSPLFMVLARRLWLHNMITRHLSTTFVDIQHFNSHYVLTPHLCTHFCPTQLFHTQFFDTHFPTHALDTQHFYTHSCPHRSFTHSTFTHDSRLFHTHHFYTIP